MFSALSRLLALSFAQANFVAATVTSREAATL